MRLVYSSKSHKQLKKLPKYKRTKIVNRIRKLKENPYRGKKLSGQFEGLYSLKIWPYRVIYQFSSGDRLIEIVTIRHRQSVYK